MALTNSDIYKPRVQDQLAKNVLLDRLYAAISSLLVYQIKRLMTIRLILVFVVTTMVTLSTGENRSEVSNLTLDLHTSTIFHDQYLVLVLPTKMT